MGFDDAASRIISATASGPRKRFREAGADSLPDYELQEIILFA